jgi:bisphosphoglycerate-independent phosphoglycerate mutase (AlkP superfamily)
MNNSERYNQLDKAWERTELQYKILELHKSQKIISDNEYEKRFSEITTHYRDRINSIEQTYREGSEVTSSNQ